MKGVGDIRNLGAADYSMRMWLNPDLLARLGLTVTDVQNALRQQNVVNPAGQVGAEPAPPGQQLTYTVGRRGGSSIRASSATSSSARTPTARASA
jgi:HAE1 family hydrophobic/amphiphilic exporter-1